MVSLKPPLCALPSVRPVLVPWRTSSMLDWITVAQLAGQREQGEGSQDTSPDRCMGYHLALSTRCRSPMRWARAVFPPNPRWVGAGGRARASGRARAMRVGRGGARARARARWRREGRRWRCARSAGGARAGMSARARWATEVGTAPCGPTDQRFVDRGGRSPAFSEIRSPRFLRACSTRDARHGLDWITVATSGRPNGPRGTGCEEQERKILPNVARMFLRVCATRDARHGREREQREGSRLWSSGR